MRIREMTAADHPAVMDLWRTTPGIGLGDADTRDGISSYLKRNPGMSFVAQAEAELAGAVLCGTDGRRGYLHHLAVHAAYRRQGIGRALVDRCMEALREAGVKKCHLFVFADNAEGAAFWERIGWKTRMDIRIMSREV